MLGQTLVVDPIAGNDATGTPNRQDLPYQTIAAAVAAVASGTLDHTHVLLMPGVHPCAGGIPLPEVERLTIGGMGDQSDTTVDLVFGQNMFTMFDGYARVALTIERFRVASNGSRLLYADSGGALDWFSTYVEGLILRDIVLVGAGLSMQGIQIVKMRNVAVSGDNANFDDCGYVFMDSCEMEQLAVMNTNPAYVGILGRGYKEFRGSSFNGVTITGAPLVSFDSACHVQGAMILTLESYAGMGDVALRFEGSLGSFSDVATVNRNSNLSEYNDGPSLVLQVEFGLSTGTNVWQGNGEMFSGIDFSGARVAGRSRWRLYSGSIPMAPQPSFVMIGAIGASLGDVECQAGRPAVSTGPNRSLFTFRDCSFKRKSKAASVTIDYGDVDLRGSNLSNVTLVNSGNPVNGFGAFDRDFIALGPINVVGGSSQPVVFSTSTPAQPPLPPYAAGAYQVFTTPVQPSTASIGTGSYTYTGFTYLASAGGGQALFRVMRN